MSTLSNFRNETNSGVATHFDGGCRQRLNVALSSTNVSVDGICHPGENVTVRRVPVKSIDNIVVIPVKVRSGVGFDA